MLKFGVSLDKYEKLRNHMKELGIHEKDLNEVFTHSSGPGGQNVNKVATCVHLHHIPSDVGVKCQKYRKQGLNRYWARRTLMDLIEKGRRQVVQDEVQEKERLRRKNRKPTKLAKEIMLEEKKFHSEKKKKRKSIDVRKVDDYT